MDTYWHYVTQFLGFASKPGSKSGNADRVSDQLSRSGRAADPAGRSGKHNKKGSTMFRKLGIGLATLAFLTPGIAAALGVGDYKLDSYLNQPLDMQVELHKTGDLEATEILVDLAGETDFQNAGVERTYFLSELDFEVRIDDQGGVLHITTDRPVREPYLNFVIEVLWPTGRMLREYTVLLDPPGAFEEEAAQQTQPAESVARPVQPQAPAEPVTRREDTDSRRIVAQSEGYQGDVDHDRYEVRANDTMWRIAVNHRPSTNVSVQQMLVAIQRLNPEAFIDGNVNLVREGTVLRIPTREEIRAISTRQALGDIASQNRRWREMLRARGIDPDKAQLDGRARETAGGDHEAAPSEGQVKLVTDSGEATGEGAGAGAGGDAAALQNELAIREESLDRLRRENQELASRLDDLEEQVNTSEDLLELRNQKIARLQEELRQLQQQQGVEVSGDLLEPVEEPAEPTEDAPADEEVATAEEQAQSPTAAAEEGEPSPDTDMAAADQPAADGEAPADEPVEDEQAEKTAEAAPAQPARPAAPAQPAEPEAPQSLVGQILDFVMGNLIMLAVGLVVIIALVVGGILMLRKRAAGEDEEPLVDVEEDNDFLPAGLMEDEEESDFGGEEEEAEAPRGEGQDPLEEVDVYVAYGRYPQAVEYLRNEIKKAPERGDLKIRLLEVLAEMRDTDGFEQEAAQLAGTDEDIDARIEALRQDLGSAGGEEPSLDDLEMDLNADLDGGDQAPSESAGEEEDETLVLDATEVGGEGEEDEGLGDFEFSLDEDEGGAAEPDEPTESFELDTEGASDETLELDSTTEGGGDEEDLGDLEFSLDDLDTGEEEEGGREEFSMDDLEGETADTGDQEEELSLEGFDEEEDKAGEEEFTLEGFDEEEPAADDDNRAALEAEPSLDLDEGFDLEGGGEQDFEDVELQDVSSEFSEAAEEPSSEEIDLSLDDLDEPEEQAPEEPSTEVRSAIEEEAAPEKVEQAPEPEPEPEPEPQPEPEAPAEEQAMSADDLLGDDDDFDFLGESDENATKLDLAKAYIDMGDAEGARDILNEVLAEGSEEQQSEARDLLSQVS